MVVANVKALDFTFCPLLDTVIVNGEFSAKELHCNKLPDFMSVKKFKLDTKQAKILPSIGNIEETVWADWIIFGSNEFFCNFAKVSYF